MSKWKLELIHEKNIFGRMETTGIINTQNILSYSGA